MISIFPNSDQSKFLKPFKMDFLNKYERKTGWKAD